MLHNSGDPELETLALRLYLDESGGDDPGTPDAVVGGMLIARVRFLAFEDAWDEILKKHTIEPPLHMKEFSPNGRFAKVSHSCREALFRDVADAIRSHRVGSISASVSNAEYRKKVPAEARKVFSVYGMCFLLAAFGTQVIAAANSHHQRIPIIMDSGNPYADHVRKSHANIQQLQREHAEFLNIGALAFEHDTNFGTLQAADVIAWGARKRASRQSFRHGFGPIDQIFQDRRRHQEASWTPRMLTEVGEYLSRAIAEQRQKDDV
ncbi:MAG: DUF3800 domain-containing protein [Terriglobales bacterium]